MNFFKKVGQNLKSKYNWTCERKVHIIPFFLFTQAFATANDKPSSGCPSLSSLARTDPVSAFLAQSKISSNELFFQVLAIMACCVFYYMLVLFPDFYREWKKKHPKEI